MIILWRGNLHFSYILFLGVFFVPCCLLYAPNISMRTNAKGFFVSSVYTTSKSSLFSLVNKLSKVKHEDKDSLLVWYFINVIRFTLYPKKNCMSLKNQHQLYKLSETAKCMISEIITICKLLLVNPATSAAGERSFSSARRLKTWLRSTMTQTRFSNLTILNTHKQRTDKLCLIDVANEFAALNENRKSNFGTFKESDLKMSEWHSSVASVGFSLEVSLFI